VDASDHGKTILSGIIGYSSLKALDYALLRLNPDYFDDRVQQNLFILLQRYADQHRGIPSRAALADMLRNEKPGTALMYQEYYDALAAVQPPFDAFSHSIAMLRDLAFDRRSRAALTKGYEILGEGLWEDKAWLQGHAAARSWVLGEFAAVERDAATEAGKAEGDMRGEEEEILGVYAKAQALRVQGLAPGVEFGIPDLDARLPGGTLPGELCMVVAWTTAGKTSWCVNWSWHAAVMQHKNVVIFTTETLRPQVRVKLLSRHSRHPKFGMTEGIDSRRIRAGTVQDESAFRQVLKDLTEAEDYGQLYIAQVPRGGTMGAIEGRLAAIARTFHPDLVIIDYLQLLRPDVVRRDAAGHEVYGNVVKAAKELAIDYEVPVVSPWQVSREGRRELKSTGGYGLQHLSLSAEASNTSDIVLGLADLEADTTGGKRVELDLEVMKNRDGERGAVIQLTADFRTSYFGLRAAAASNGDTPWGDT
jgi:replicative DNA helicase